MLFRIPFPRVPGICCPALLMEVVMVTVFLGHDFVIVLNELKADGTERSLYRNLSQEASGLRSFLIALEGDKWREVSHDSIDELLERVRSVFVTTRSSLYIDDFRDSSWESCSFFEFLQLFVLFLNLIFNSSEQSQHCLKNSCSSLSESSYHFSSSLLSSLHVRKLAGVMAL